MAKEPKKQESLLEDEPVECVGVRPHRARGYSCVVVKWVGGKATETVISPAPEGLVAARARARVELGRRMP